VRNILRLSLTLGFVGVISAALLTGVNNVTAPIISERQEAEYMQALEIFFPGVAGFESEDIDGNHFDVILDENGDMMGVMATVQQQGYDGTITYNLALDENGVINGVRVVSHSETPGIGDVITTDGFQEQFIGKSFEDPLTAGEDVDIVSGATISTAAMVNSIRSISGVIAENFLGFEAAVINIAEVPDGKYQGSAPGLNGPIVVEVEVSGGAIIAIEVIEQSETPTYYVESYPLIPDQIIAEQSFDIDTKTGATISAEGIINAVKNALMEALGFDTEEPEEDEQLALDININEVPDGIYEGSGEGFYGDITVEVEVTGGEIVSISILQQEETPEYYTKAYPMIPDLIVEEQSLEIDTSTGATFSSKGIVEAVFNALSGALETDGGGEE
jgi:NosR/NirI family transcriptional regulator, nitrous oxide reductase regulator